MSAALCPHCGDDISDRHHSRQECSTNQLLSALTAERDALKAELLDQVMGPTDGELDIIAQLEKERDALKAELVRVTSRAVIETDSWRTFCHELGAVGWAAELQQASEQLQAMAGERDALKAKLRARDERIVWLEKAASFGPDIRKADDDWNTADRCSGCGQQRSEPHSWQECHASSKEGNEALTEQWLTTQEKLASAESARDDLSAKLKATGELPNPPGTRPWRSWGR